MGSDGMRFRPPERVLPDGVRWALIRAFGPEERAPVAAPDDAVEAAIRLRVAPRIASRSPAPALAAEIGAEGAERLRRERMAAAARATWIADAGAEAVAILREAGLAPVLLKLVALTARGCLAEGARAASDVDLLLDERTAEAARAALLAAGFGEAGAEREEHHLAALLHPRGVVVEIHTSMLGVRPGRRSADAAELDRAGLLEPAGGVWRGARLPVREALAAHALAHGLAQHGLSPRAYPLLQPLADLVDLGWPARGGDGVVDPSDVARVLRLLRGTLSDREVAAAAEAVDRLRRKAPDLLEGVASDGDAAALLHHMVWGLLDERYRDALRVRAVTEPLSDLPPARALARATRRALWPSRDELAAIYGRPRGEVPFWLRLYRPVDLVGRTLRSAWSARRLRQRGGA
jgi:hypothetical protein